MKSALVVVAADTAAVEVVAGTEAAAGVAVGIAEAAAAEPDVEVAAAEIAAGVGVVVAAVVVGANGATNQQGEAPPISLPSGPVRERRAALFFPISAGHVSHPTPKGNHGTSSRESQTSRLDRPA